MTEIIPGIYQLQIPIPNNPLGCTNVYLVQADDGYLLVDAGWNNREAFQSLKKQMAEISIDFKDISRIIVTHGHHDHYGLAGKLKQRSQAKITLHYLDKILMDARELNMAEFLRQTKQWLHINGVPGNELPAPRRAPAGKQRFVTPPPPDITLHGGETISAGSFNLQVVWTPGHSPGHICLYEPTHKILFSGDHILPVITPNISLRTQSGTNPLGDFLNSLNIVKQLDVNLVLPAHEHLFTDLPKRVDEIVQHHQQRNSEILGAIKTKPKTAYQISTEITWMPSLGGVKFKNLVKADKGMAVSETLAHLEFLNRDSMVDKFTRDNIIYYQYTR